MRGFDPWPSKTYEIYLLQFLSHEYPKNPPNGRSPLCASAMGFSAWGGWLPRLYKTLLLGDGRIPWLLRLQPDHVQTGLSFLFSFFRRRTSFLFVPGKPPTGPVFFCLFSPSETPTMPFLCVFPPFFLKGPPPPPQQAGHFYALGFFKGTAGHQDGRSPLRQALLLGLVAKEHVLLCGPSGSAKRLAEGHRLRASWTHPLAPYKSTRIGAGGKPLQKWSFRASGGTGVLLSSVWLTLV